MYFAIAALALSTSPITAQTAKPAAHAATHTAAAHSATHAAAAGHDPAACFKLPELSSKVPALPAGAPCARALYTMTVVPDVRLDYAAPVEGDLAKELGIEPVSFTLAYIDTHAGAGELAQPHKFYTVKYTGYLADGSKFDSSDDHPGKEPFTFQASAHQVVAGWDTGFAGMHVGGRRRLFVPFQLAYGPNGRPPAIPARAELIFDMELVSQSDTAPAPKPEPAAAEPAPAPAPAPAKPAVAAPATPPASTAPKPQ
jgi:peptidylprolyl isomerase